MCFAKLNFLTNLQKKKVISCVWALLSFGITIYPKVTNALKKAPVVAGIHPLGNP